MKKSKGLLDSEAYNAAQQEQMSKHCRKDDNGIPESLRAAAWTMNIVRSCDMTLKSSLVEEKAQRKHVAVYEHGWSLVKKDLFTGDDDGDGDGDGDGAWLRMPDFGSSDAAQKHSDMLRFYEQLQVQHQHQHQHQHGDRDRDKEKRERKMAFARILCAAKQLLNIEFAPLLPDIVMILLSAMQEAHVFGTLRVLSSSRVKRFLFVSEADHYSICKTFAGLFHKYHPKTAQLLSDNHFQLTKPNALDPIFKRFFTPLLRYEHVLRIMDLYTVDGLKVLFRFGITLLKLCKHRFKHSSPSPAANQDPHAWCWTTVRDFAHHPDFDFNLLLKKAYGFFGAGLNTRKHIRGRQAINRQAKRNEPWVIRNIQFGPLLSPITPLPLSQPHHPPTQHQHTPILARNSTVRSHFADWLPHSLKSSKLHLIYTTASMGRSLHSFYHASALHKARHTITIMEVIDTGHVIGIYASQTWTIQPRPFGDGNCFLFRISPDPKPFKWSITPQTNLHDIQQQHANLQDIAILEQIMVAKSDFLSMGASKDGGFGLRLDKDLLTGTSSCAEGFQNDPLGGQPNNTESTFEIGLLEVYHLIL